MSRSKPNIYRRIKRICNAYSRIKIKQIEGEKEPEICGKSYHYENKSGEWIRHPSAYSKVGWSSMIYKPSTLRIEVGKEWIRKNITKEELASYVSEKILNA